MTKYRRPILVALIGLLLGLTMAVPAHAYSITVQAVPVDSGCSSALTWRGKVTGATVSGYFLYPSSRTQDSGTVRYCTSLLRVIDDNDSADYYMLETTSDWTWTTRPGAASYVYYYKDSPWATSIRSNTTARLSEYRATQSFTESSSCWALDLSVSLGFFSLGTSQQVDCGTTVTRTVLGSTNTAWTGVDVRDLRHTELAYIQAVAEGKEPTYTVTYTRPNYTYTWTQTKNCVGGNGSAYTCVTAYKPTQQTSSATTTHTRSS